MVCCTRLKTVNLMALEPERKVNTMNTEMNSTVITTEVVDLIPAPETIVTPEPKSYKPSLKTCVIAGASIGGVTGGIIAADRITARRNLRNTMQLAINETAREVDLAIGVKTATTEDKAEIMKRVKAQGDMMLKGSPALGSMSGIFFKRKLMEKDIRVRATIIEAFYQTIIDYGKEINNDGLVTFFTNVLEHFQIGIEEAIKAL